MHRWEQLRHCRLGAEEQRNTLWTGYTDSSSAAWIAPYRKPEAKHSFWGLKDLQWLERANEGQEVENDSHNSSSWVQRTKQRERGDRSKFNKWSTSQLNLKKPPKHWTSELFVKVPGQKWLLLPQNRLCFYIFVYLQNITQEHNKLWEWRLFSAADICSKPAMNLPVREMNGRNGDGIWDRALAIRIRSLTLIFTYFCYEGNFGNFFHTRNYFIHCEVSKTNHWFSYDKY